MSLEEELRRLNTQLNRLERRMDIAIQGPKAQIAVSMPALMRQIILARRLRDEFFPGGLFADPAWDIMLDLLVAHMEGRLVNVSSLAAASAVPNTTAHRWIEILAKRGILKRSPDPRDSRRVLVALSSGAAKALQAYFSRMSLGLDARTEYMGARPGHIASTE